MHAFKKLLVLAAVVAAAGCGSTGSPGPTGPAGATGPAGPAGDAGPGPGAQGTPQSRLFASITKVTVPNASTTGGTPTVTYRMYTDTALTKATTCIGGGNTGYAPFAPNFTIAKLLADTQNTGTQRWQSYINFSFEQSPKVAAAEGGHDSYPGTLVDNGDGSCSYTYQADLSKMVASSSTKGVTEAYEPNATTRFGMQNNPTDPNATHPAFDATFTVVPATGAVAPSDPRELVTQEACNGCHRQVAHHGAKRLSVPYCVSCHNQGTPDPDPGSSKDSLSLDMAVMIHRIHQGKNLPSVSLTDLTAPPNTLPPTSPPTTSIVINGTDYTNVGFPQDTGNCSVCHNVASTITGNDYWKTQASIEACGACHDRTWFQLGTPPAGWVKHTAGPIADGACSLCHGPGTALNAAAVHPLAVPALAAQKSKLTIASVTGAPGAPLKVSFSVTNPQTGAPQDLASDPLWTTSGARLAFDFAYSILPGLDWTNSGSGATTGFGSTVPAGSPAPGQPLGFDVLAGIKAGPPTVTKNTDGSYSFTTAYILPLAAVGSGIAVLEGHPEVGTSEVPVRTATLPFAITDSTPQTRRLVADIQKCDTCHGMLVLHGANRTDNLEACVACHNGEATDVTQRPQSDGKLGIDNKTEQSIDFATMIHGIHTSQVVVYSFTVGPANPIDYTTLMFPEGNAVNHCDICHGDRNPFPATDTMGIVNGVTQITALSPNQASYLRTTKATAVCSSCHSALDPVTHMVLNGGALSLTQAAIDSSKPGSAGVEACDVCHGAGKAIDPAQFHNIP